jgi:DNA-binding cell septation regulator SpoVG
MSVGNISIEVEIRWATKPGNVKAYADIRIEFPEGELVLHGFSIIEQPGKDPWVGFPSNRGNIPGKFFPVVEADGSLKEEIVRTIIEAYRNGSKK